MGRQVKFEDLKIELTGLLDEITKSYPEFKNTAMVDVVAGEPLGHLNELVTLSEGSDKKVYEERKASHKGTQVGAVHDYVIKINKFLAIESTSRSSNLLDEKLEKLTAAQIMAIRTELALLRDNLKEVSAAEGKVAHSSLENKEFFNESIAKVSDMMNCKELHVVNYLYRVIVEALQSVGGFVKNKAEAAHDFVKNKAEAVHDFVKNKAKTVYEFVKGKFPTKNEPATSEQKAVSAATLAPAPEAATQDSANSTSESTIKQELAEGPAVR